jgi:UDP-glucose 4-epimerase
MFDLTACAFRFGNVVGPRQTHGVGFDFVRRLRKDPTVLSIRGDGQQSKSYIDVGDVVSAVLTTHQRETAPFRAFNVATGDHVTVTEIAHLALDVLGLDPAGVTFEYTGGDRGWKGDVPIVRLNTDRIRALGWTHTQSSAEAVAAAMGALARDDAAGLL